MSSEPDPFAAEVETVEVEAMPAPEAEEDGSAQHSTVDSSAASPAAAAAASPAVASSSPQPSPIRHALPPSTSAPSASSPSYDSDAMLTPRSLARKIAAHQEQHSFEGLFPSEAPSDVSGGAGAGAFDAAYPPPLSENESAPRFRCTVGGYKLKGEGLDTHTRYEIATRWKASVVDESAAAIQQIKDKKSSEEDDSPSQSDVQAKDSPAAATLPPTKIPPTSKVGRRFTDFIFLQTLLTSLYPSHLIPCLPPKGLLQRFDESFVSQRRRGLQRFLSALADMPAPVCEERCIADFLIATTAEWERTVASLTSTHGLGGAKSSWLVQNTMSLGSKLLSSVTRTNLNPEEHAHDAHFVSALESATHHSQLQLQYEGLHKQFDSIVAAERDLSAAWLALYAGFEDSDDSMQASRISHTSDLLGLDFAQFLPLTQRIGVVQQKRSDTQAVAITDLLQHTHGMLEQVRALFARRAAVSLGVQAADNQCKAAASQLEAVRRKVAEGKKTREDEQRQQTVLTQCEAILRDRQSALAAFHATAEQQIRAYTAARRVEMRQVIVQFIQQQIEHEAHIANHWGTLLAQLEQQKL